MNDKKKKYVIVNTNGGAYAYVIPPCTPEKVCLHAVDDDGPTGKIKRIAIKEHWKNVPGGIGRCKAHDETAWPLFNAQKRAVPAELKPRKPSQPRLYPPEIKEGMLGTYCIGGDSYGFCVGKVNLDGKELELFRYPNETDPARHLETITWRRTNEWVKKKDSVAFKRRARYSYYFGSAVNKLDPSF